MGDKKKKGKVEKITVDGVETSEMKFPKLQEFAAVLLKKLKTARSDRNFQQAQCSRMKSAWEMTIRKLQDTKYQIKATAMNRDKMEFDVCGQALKEMTDLEKFIKFDLNEKLMNMKNETKQSRKDLDAKWDETTLEPLLQQKTELKLRIDQTDKDIDNFHRNLQEKLDKELEDYVNYMDNETEKIIENEIIRLAKQMENIRLTSDTSFFRTQEEYNRIIREMIENGKKNTGTLREFYRRITEDDIIMIIIMEKQWAKLKRIVNKKHVMCKKITEQSATIESSKGQLEMNLRRAKRKMKLYDTNTLALDRSNMLCDDYALRKAQYGKEFKESHSKEIELTDKLRKMEDHIKHFQVLFELRQKEVFEPLQFKIKTLNRLIKKDAKIIEAQIANLPPDKQDEAKMAWEKSELLSTKCMNYLVFDLARLCSTHDNLIDFVERKLETLNIPKIGNIKYKRINFDVTAYGLGPVGLITKYP